MKNPVFCISFFLTITLSAQQKLVPAKVVLCKSSDTLTGEIKINPKKIHEIYKKITFKPSAGPQKLLRPGMACAFFMEGRKFIRMDFEGQSSEFLEVLAEGKINFYKGYAEFVNLNETSFEPVFYFSDKQGNLEEVDEKKFAKQIKQRAIKDYPALKELDNLRSFDEKILADWIKKYNQQF